MSLGQKKIILNTHPSENRDSYLAALLHDANNRLVGMTCISELETGTANESLRENAFVILIGDMRKQCRSIMKDLMHHTPPDDLNQRLTMLRNRSRVIHSLLSGLEINLKEIVLDDDTFQQSLEEFSQLMDRSLRYLEYQDKLEVVEYKDIGEEIRSTVRLFRQRYPEVSFTLNLEHACYTAYEPESIRRLLENLLTNAVQSLDKRTGEIHIRLSQQHMDADALPSEAVKEGMYISIGIEDNGSGIAPEVMERLRNSSFTTKPRGSGIGLRSAKQSVVRHKGHLILESEKGRGTRVTTLIPSTLPPPPRLPKIDGFGGGGSKKV